jgi:hypothetical protein
VVDYAGEEVVLWNDPNRDATGKSLMGYIKKWCNEKPARAEVGPMRGPKQFQTVEAEVEVVSVIASSLLTPVRVRRAQFAIDCGDGEPRFWCWKFLPPPSRSRSPEAGERRAESAGREQEQQ